MRPPPLLRCVQPWAWAACASPFQSGVSLTGAPSWSPAGWRTRRCAPPAASWQPTWSASATWHAERAAVAHRRTPCVASRAAAGSRGAAPFCRLAPQHRAAAPPHHTLFPLFSLACAQSSGAFARRRAVHAPCLHPPRPILSPRTAPTEPPNGARRGRPWRRRGVPRGRLPRAGARPLARRRLPSTPPSRPLIPRHPIASLPTLGLPTRASAAPTAAAPAPAQPFPLPPPCRLTPRGRGRRLAQAAPARARPPRARQQQTAAAETLPLLLPIASIRPASRETCRLSQCPPVSCRESTPHPQTPAQPLHLHPLARLPCVLRTRAPVFP